MIIENYAEPFELGKGGDGVSVKYIAHQREAIDKLRSGCILCAGVGTGKSITALGYFFEKICHSVQWTDGRERGPLLTTVPLYVITTAKKRDSKDWEKEFDKFDYDVPLTVDSWNNMHKYVGVMNAFFIFDEQRVVGSGKWVRDFYRITARNRWILLSATPGDTWEDYIPVFVANGFYKNRTQFLYRHAVITRWGGYPKIEKWLEVSRLETLRRRITVVMKFEKHTTRHFEEIITAYDREKYRRVSEERWNPFEGKPVRDIGEACRLMRQIVNSDGERLEAVEQLSKRHPRLIIFYNFDYELEQLRTLSTLAPMAEWNGHHHEAIPKGDRWLYLVQYSAGCEGWNCVETNAMIFFSQSYSYKQMEQAAGRIDRLNTPYDDLWYYTLRSHATIDVAIGKALKGKKNFNERLFGEQTRWKKYP